MAARRGRPAGRSRRTTGLVAALLALGCRPGPKRPLSDPPSWSHPLHHCNGVHKGTASDRAPIVPGTSLRSIPYGHSLIPEPEVGPRQHGVSWSRDGSQAPLATGSSRVPGDGRRDRSGQRPGVGDPGRLLHRQQHLGPLHRRLTD